MVCWQLIIYLISGVKMRILRNISRLMKYLIGFNWKSKIKLHPSATMTVHKSVVFRKGKINIGKNSSLIIEENVKINAKIFISENCNLLIRKNSFINNSIIEIQNQSIVDLGEGGILEGSEKYPIYIRVNNGTLHLAEKVIIRANISVQFGGILTIGKHSGIGYGSEIRCEERIDIGEYVVISYDVCIYDTNTHSTDWKERRKRIDNGYPNGMWEKLKPDTKPIHIGDDVWIGKGATILKGCIIGKRNIIGIRTTLSNEQIEDDSVVVTAKPRIISK